MALEMLKCSICPKKPYFSDTSHLLTHVSSKGHLSNLHKLQVRSHQEMEAGVELAGYNQWYQQFGLGQLLSERLQQKETRQANKRRATARRGACVTQQIPIDQELLDPPLPPKRAAKPRNQSQMKTRDKQRGGVDDDSDVDYSPIKRSRYTPLLQCWSSCSLTAHSGRRPRRFQISSPVKRSQSSDGHHSSEEDCPAEDEPLVLATPEHSKLKGTVWPGMDLFDAASDEMKKKRNQKKDGSVVRRMERLAALVEPTEVIFSPGGNIRKARHIDDLEDASSLIDGESPIPKVKQVRAPRKRHPLAEKDANIPRLVKRKVKGKGSKRDAGLSVSHGLPPLPYLPSSSTGDSHGLGSRYIPTEDDEDFKPPIEAFASRRRSARFPIFHDASPGYGNHIPISDRRNPLQSGHQMSGGASYYDLPKASATWFHPQYQSALQYTNSYTAYRPVTRDFQGFYEMNTENVDPTADPTAGCRGPSTNPLSWKSPTRPILGTAIASDSPFGGFFGLFPCGTQSDDPFVTTKNPLAHALEHLEGQIDQVDVKQQSTPPTDMACGGSAEV